MWFDGERQPNTLYVANTSRGKDSTAMLRAIQLMGWPLDMIVSVDIWFDETTPAELPPMVKFKNDEDKLYEIYLMWDNYVSNLDLREFIFSPKKTYLLTPNFSQYSG